MRYASPLLVELASAQGTALLDGSEQDIVVPPFSYVFISPPRRERLTAAFIVTEPQRQSFTTSGIRTQTGVQPIVFDRICTFARGLWRITATLASFSDFTQAANDATANALLLGAPAGVGSALLLAAVRVNAVPQVQRGVWTYLFVEEEWTLQIQTDSTAAGQNSQNRAMVRAELLV